MPCRSTVFQFPPECPLLLLVSPGLSLSFFQSFSTFSPWCFFSCHCPGHLSCGMFVWLFLLVCSLFCISCGLEVSLKASMGSGQTFCDPVHTPTRSTSGDAGMTCSVGLGWLARMLLHPTPHTCPRLLFSQFGYFILQRWSQYQRHQHPLET